MQRTEATQYIKDTYLQSYVQTITEKAPQGNYICPLCGSGTGRNHSGAFSIMPDKTSWKCFACDKGGDIFDLIGEYEQISDFNGRLKRAAELFNVSIDSYTPSPQAPQGSRAEIRPRTAPPRQSAPAPQPQADFTAYYTRCSENLKTSTQAQAYLTARGISLETAIKYGLGYDEKADPASAPGGIGEIRHPTPRIIVPYDSGHYMGRDTTQGSKYPKINSKRQDQSGRVPLFNGGALYGSSEPLFITEGAFDALSIIQAGGEAIATNSTANINYLLELMKSRTPGRDIIIALDADGAGAKAADHLRAGLDALGIEHYTPPTMPANIKDYNEYLQKEPEGFKEYIQAAIRAAGQPAEERREEYYNTQSVYGHIQSFIDLIGKSSTAPFYSTGFESLDKALDGGLYAGLYCIGAISSLGKTTFCLQIADNLAAAGHDVLFFSLEMAEEELISKSISRLTYTLNRDRGGEQLNAKSTRGIMTGRRYAKYNQEERQLIHDAIYHYGNYAKHLFISVGVGTIGINEIRGEIEEHKRRTGRAPIVIIDYLQILAPTDPHFTDKQNTDKAVLELKRISRDLDTPIIGISSFNRDNYKEPVNLAAFKESGAIEYSSDVLIGLQYLGMDYQSGESETARTKRIRDLKEELESNGRQGKSQAVQVKILKARNGSKGDIALDFYPMFNYFEESTSTSTAEITQGSSTNREREELYKAFANAGDGNKATLKAIAECLGRRATTVKQMLSKYPEFVLNGDTVTLEDSGREPF